MALNRRQCRLYSYRVSLYKPAVLASAPGDLEANDAQTQYTAAFTDVPAYLEPTPELDVIMDAGRGPEQNLFVLDKWHFDAAQAIYDTWVIKMTGSDPQRPAHPYIGRCWVCRDNSQVVSSQGRRSNNFQMVYAGIENIPGISGPVEGIA